MRKREIRACISFLLILVLCMAAGCSREAVQTTPSHSWGPIHPAAPATFFHEGNVAYYQCTDCARLSNGQMQEVDSVTTPKLSPDLSICVNGDPTRLVLESREASQISWSLESLTVEAGDVITICPSSGNGLTAPFSAEGIVDENGIILQSAANAAVALVATPDELVLSVRSGVMVDINGLQYPMDCMDGQAQEPVYVYGYAEFQPGDRFVIIDRVDGRTYGYDALAPELAWNIYDFHRGENGEFVIDRQGRYLLTLGKGGTGTVSVTKAFAPAQGGEFYIAFRDEHTKKLPMAEAPAALETGAFDDFIRYGLDENTDKDLRVYSAAGFLKAGTQFNIENAAASVTVTGDHLTDVLGPSDCFRLNQQYIEITQDGTYLIKYLPWRDSISLAQLSTGGFADAAAEFDKKVASIPSHLELYYGEQIKTLYRQYRTLPDGIKSLLKISEKLETLHRNVLALEQEPAPVTYYLNTPNTNHVYRSRKELFRAFYTDFYYYIAAFYGTKRLQTYGVNCVGDFLELAENSDDSDFRGIGYAAKEYFLVSRSNGILAEQPEDTFLGFCYQNDLYQEILPFFIRFFAYWRLDEGYANRSNRGADLFVEGWAPTVDIAKFFYYDRQTSYVKSERILDCFAHTAGVVYQPNSADPLPTITLRGYVFEGWYDNPQFTGSPVTQLEPEKGSITLYAKWGLDREQQDQDSADLVDIYIYNLTTQKAVINTRTVGYVKNMYDALPESAKALVTQLPALEGFIKP